MLNLLDSDLHVVACVDAVDETIIEQYMLTEEESRLKEILWKSQNADYLAK